MAKSFAKSFRPPLVMINEKLSRTTAQVSQLIYLTPFLSLLVIHFAVGESIYPSTLIGLVLIVTGILLQQYGQQLLKIATAKP